MYKYYQKLLVFRRNTFGIKFITMKDLEFYIFENELWCISSDKKNKRISENDTEIINEILSIVREQYPNAYNALSECYIKSSKNVPYYQCLMARRFAKCNFGNLDSTVEDINNNGKVNFEHVQCPLRGECKYEDILKIVLNDKTFSQREAEKIAGSRNRLFELVGNGSIRAEKKPSDRQNGRWYCNAYDVIKFACIK